ncbi:MAG: O-antigen ligase family protein [Lysobacterales bacterium]|jgi:O-antigen ligase
MSRWYDKTAFVLLALLVLLSPIPLGSNRGWSWSLMALLSAGLSLVWLLARLLARRRLFAGLHFLIPLLFTAALVWAWLQAQPWMPDAWKHPIWQLAASALATSLPGTISVAPEDNYTAIMRLLSYGLVFYLAFQLARDRHLAHRAFRWIAVAATLYAVYGLLSYFGVLRELQWYQDDAYGRDVRATFVNRNHFANWLGIAIVCAVAAFYDRMMRLPQHHKMILQSRQRRVERFLKRAWLPLSGLILMVSALVSTHSRGGFIATFCGGAALLLLIDRKQRTVSLRARAIALSALAVCAVAFFISNEILMQRFDDTEVDSQGRVFIYRDTVKGIADNPLLGYGYGAYEDAFHLYKSEDKVKNVDRAHNTYLEDIFELGLPAALCLFGAALGLLLTCLRGIARRERDWVYPAAGAGATVMVAVHATMDFGLQIPATAYLYALVMGVACAQSFSSRL